VPAHIGVEVLKKICFVTLRPLFLRWSRSYPLNIEDVSLRLKNWLELVPPAHGEDSDAIFPFFFTEKKNGVKRFTPGNGLELVLSIPYELYSRALAHSLSDSDLETVSCSIMTYDNMLTQLLPYQQRLTRREKARHMPLSSQISVPSLLIFRVL
jgi:hypothetical protein